MIKYLTTIRGVGCTYGLVELSDEDYAKAISNGEGFFKPRIPKVYQNRNCIFIVIPESVQSDTLDKSIII